MNIAYLVNQYPKGSHTFIRREIVALEQRGVQVQRFSIRPTTDPLVDEADRCELAKTRTILAVGWPGLLRHSLAVAVTRPGAFGRALWLCLRLGYRSDRGLLRHLAYLAEACVLVRWLLESGAQHLHAHFATNSATVALLCHALGGPAYSFTVHGPDDFDRAPWLGLNLKIAQARFVVAVSDFGRSQLYRWCDVQHWPKIHVIYCGLDETFLAQPQVPIPDTPRLVCVARLCEDKGQLLLLEAVHCLRQAGLACDLTLVGDGPLHSQIEARIRQLGLGEAVRITGWLSGAEVREQLWAARAMVLPSFAENLPLAIMETLALGRPVVSTYIAGIPELVEAGVNGWLVPAGSVEALTSALREVLQTPVVTLERLGQAGARRVGQQHNGRQSAQALHTLFEASQTI